MRLADPQRAIAPLQVLEQLVQAVKQVLSARFNRLLEDFRVGGKEVGRRGRADELPGVEIDFPPGLLIKPLDVINGVMQVIGRQQIGLLDEIKERLSSQPAWAKRLSLFSG